jgi:hypothetical protein
VPVAEKRPKVEYTANVREFARRLHEQNGWGVAEIRAALSKHGHLPAHNTVLCWIDDDYCEERRERGRIEMRRRNGSGPGKLRQRRVNPWDSRLDRMRDLRGIGLSFRAIAALMSHDFGVDLTANRVEYLLKEKPKTRTVKRLLWPQGELS